MSHVLKMHLLMIFVDVMLIILLVWHWLQYAKATDYKAIVGVMSKEELAWQKRDWQGLTRQLFFWYDNDTDI